MKSNLFAAVAVAALVLCAPAIGKPKISGDYAFSSRTYCQPTHNVSGTTDFNGQWFVNGVNLPFTGLFSQEVGTANFDPASGNFGVSEVQDYASPTMLQIPGQTQGFLMSQRSQQLAGTFSNTATTVTLNWPSGGTYAAAYGAVKKGIVQYMALVGLVTINATTCSQQVEFSHT